MRFILALLFWLVITAGSSAQIPCTGTVRCTVVEAPGFAPIPFVLFEAIGRKEAVLSDAAGIIRLDSICPDGLRLRVLTTGFDPDTFLVTAEGKAQRLVLRGSTRALKGTDVTATRIEAASTLNSDSIQQQEIDRAAGKVFSDVLEQLSGVTTLRTGQQVAKPVIHGLHSQRLLILHAGVRLEGQQWGTEHAPEIDPFAAGRITVLKGGSALRYGADALGGVILVEPREIAHELGIRAELNAVGMSNGRQGVLSAMAEQHLGRFFDVCWRLQGTIKRGGNIHTPDWYLDNTGVQEYNYSGTVGIERKRMGAEVYLSAFNATNGIFSGAHIGNTSDLTRILETGETITADTFTYSIGRPRQAVRHHLLSARVWYAVPGLGKFSLRTGTQLNRREEYDRDRPYSDSLAALDEPELKLKLMTRTADLVFESASRRGYSLLSGLSLFTQDNQYSGLRYFVPNYRLVDLGGFALLRKKVSAFEFELGLRYDFRDQQVYRNVSGQVVRDNYRFQFPNVSFGLIWRADTLNQLKFHIGSARRAPSINEWFSDGLHHGTATYETGDPSLGLEKAWLCSIGWKHVSDRFSSELGLYSMLINDYIYLVPSDQPVLTLSGAFPAYRYTGVDAYIGGVDASLDLQLLDHLQAGFDGSLVYAQNRTADSPLELMPAPRIASSLRWEFADRGRWSACTVQFTYRRVFRQEWIPDNTADAPAPAAYGISSIGVETRYSMFGQPIWLNLAAENLFNVRYRDYLNRLRYYSDEMGQNLVLRIKVPLSFSAKSHDHPH